MNKPKINRKIINTAKVMAQATVKRNSTDMVKMDKVLASMVEVEEKDSPSPTYFQNFEVAAKSFSPPSFFAAT